MSLPHNGRWQWPLRGMVVAIAVFAAAWAAAAPSLRELLTPEEYRKAGLDKLTDEEIRFLEARLAGAGLIPAAAARVARNEQPSPPAAAAPAGETAFGREEEISEAAVRSQQIPKEIRSRILGVFRGWEGRTQFRLENGQIWRQIDNTQFAVNLTDPVVIVEKGRFGTFYLHVDGYRSRAKVVRER